MTVAIGNPQYGGKKKNNSRLVDGDNVYRILPPLGELAAEGVWAVYESLHWGFKGTRGMRPFKCIQKKDFKTKMIKVQCPECDQIAQREATVKDQTEKLKKAGKSDAEIKDHLKPLTDWLFSHNLDKKWYVNALTTDGKITRLAMPHKMYVQLQQVINDLVSGKSNGGVPVEPIGVSGGVWFNLIRTGKGKDTTHRVEVVTETVMADVGGKKVPMQMIKSAPLTEEVISRLTNEAHDLKNSFRALTYAEIKTLVESGGDPEIVDSVFSQGEVAADRAADAAGAAEPDEEPENGAVAGGITVTGGAVPGQGVTGTGLGADAAAARVAELQAQMIAMQAQFAAQMEAVKNGAGGAATGSVGAVPAPAPAPAPAPKPAAATTPAAAMSDDDFIKQFGFSTTK